jgi:hypothetical protein
MLNLAAAVKPALMDRVIIGVFELWCPMKLFGWVVMDSEVKTG